MAKTERKEKLAVVVVCMHLLIVSLFFHNVVSIAYKHIRSTVLISFLFFLISQKLKLEIIRNDSIASFMSHHQHQLAHACVLNERKVSAVPYFWMREVNTFIFSRFIALLTVAINASNCWNWRKANTLNTHDGEKKGRKEVMWKELIDVELLMMIYERVERFFFWKNYKLFCETFARVYLMTKTAVTFH